MPETEWQKIDKSSNFLFPMHITWETDYLYRYSIGYTTFKITLCEEHNSHCAAVTLLYEEFWEYKRKITNVVMRRWCDLRGYNEGLYSYSILTQNELLLTDSDACHTEMANRRDVCWDEIASLFEISWKAQWDPFIKISHTFTTHAAY